MSEEREYVVTSVDEASTGSLLRDLVTDNETPETVPDRSVWVEDIRLPNARNTTYLLTPEEAEKLREDPRVEEVFDISLLKARKLAFQDGNFNKTTTETGEKQNWGLLRHISETNVFGSSTADPGGTYDYVLDGTGVDVVIVDSGIQADHPEFQDANGTSRVQEIDWFAESGVSGTMPANFYTDYDGHGTHVAGTVAGKTFGWAKNADIYAMKLDDLKGSTDPSSGLSIANAMDCILGWHNNKTNGRPTVVNNSWGFLFFWRTNDNAFSFSDTGGTTYAIDGGEYRSTAWSGSTKDVAKGHTGTQFSATLFGFSFAVSSVDADISQMISSGIIVCNAAGNESLKSDRPGGDDYDNYITLTDFGDFYYHRGGSPRAGIQPGFDVGSLGPSTLTDKDTKSSFSNSGPAISIYAAGSRIMSAMSDVNVDDSSFDYYLNSNFKQQLLSGTSMASPQIAGICALLLQAHPDWTPEQVVRWMFGNSKSELYSTGLDNDYGTNTSIHGGENALCFFPMHGRKTFEISST
jgi:subtilisin family serine protease